MIINQKVNINLKKYYEEKFSTSTGIGIQSQHWGENRSLSMEVIAVEYFPNSMDSGSNEKIWILFIYKW